MDSLIIFILFSGLQCQDPEAPNNSLNFQCFSASFCTYSCMTNKKLFKNTYYVSCDPKTLQWGEIPDCVGKQLLLLLLFVSPFTEPVTNFQYSVQPRPQSIVCP